MCATRNDKPPKTQPPRPSLRTPTTHLSTHPQNTNTKRHLRGWRPLRPHVLLLPPLPLPMLRLLLLLRLWVLLVVLVHAGGAVQIVTVREGDERGQRVGAG
jgi:hypothetical protein